ncbi:unannotated protein [freshwater metagenome]|uniref:Unannotated protein n=1 Tax=freshwater metagenome TaxID=449393 RepID=A0A6J7EIN0_9ZZZZ|nr:hypothetical protein [Actinomycetota bacterium]
MNVRSSIVSAVVVAGLAATVAAGRTSPAATTARFGAVPFASRPYASHRTPITTTWYCPGVPAGDSTVGGDIVVPNPSSIPLEGRITLFASDGIAPIVQDITVAARQTFTLSVGKAVQATFVSAMVELDGGEGMVEQRALFPAGNAVASCTTQTSPTWYFADGFTVDGSTDQIILTNPSSDTASVDMAFITASGKREPSAFQGDSVPPHSVKVVSVADNGLKDESVIAVQVIASRGQLIVGRAQHYFGGHRLGYSLGLGAPAPSEQVWFVGGESGTGITEQYVMFNPTAQDATVDVTVLGLPLTSAFSAPPSIPVPAGEVVTFDTTTITGLPPGVHAMVFSTLAAPSVVIERVLTKPAGDKIATTVVMGTTAEYVVPRWYLPIGVDAATEKALVVYNVDGVDTTVTVKAIGPGGEVAVPSLTDIALPAAGVITIDLTDPSVFGRSLVIESAQRLLVERMLSRGHDLRGRSGSWALPECGPCNFSSPPSL